MSTEVRSRSKRSLLRLLIFVGVVATGLAIASAVFAGWTTINLGNSAIDGTWGTADYSDANNNPNINDRDEISKAWVRYDGTNLYFRIDTIGSTALSSTNNRAVAALDCNHNGLFNDRTINGPDGDRLVIYAPGGSTGGTVNLYNYNSAGTLTFAGAVNGDYADASGVSIEWGVPLYLLYPGCRGSVSAIGLAWSTATGAGAVIDQSSTTADVLDPMDYGDTVQTLPAPPATCAAPDTATGLQCNGARSGIAPYQTPNEPLRLGPEAVDADPGNLQNANSNADDTQGTTPDDEQGIAPDATYQWKPGTASTGAGGKVLFSVYGGAARLACFIDWNKDGNWDTATEAIINANVGATTGTSRAFNIPSNVTVAGNSFPARCRVYPQPPATGAGTPTPTPAAAGPYEFGEVEDHIWSFDANGYYIAPCASPAAPSSLTITTSGATTVNLNWPPAANATQYEVWTANDAPYFDPSALTCASPAPYACATAPSNNYSHADLGDASVNHSYVVRSANNCGQVSGLSSRVGEFDFGLTAGVP